MAKKKKIFAKVIAQNMLAEGICDLWLETPLAQEVRPGQFVGVYPANAAMLLPRPISICKVDADKQAIRLVYRIVGKGTAEFALYRPGEYLSILGMLGNGFPMEQAAGKKVMLMGGGIGVPPLLELAIQLKNLPKELCPQEIIIVMGYRDAQTFLAEEFAQNGQLYIATEDGSVGTKGNVLDAVHENELKADVIYACGPMPMLRAIKHYAQENGQDAYISLEERMACGVGACLGCVCNTVQKDAHSHVNNTRICTDGPVFAAKDVDI